MAQEPRAADESGEELELLALVGAHAGDKLGRRRRACHAPIETADLEHAPEGAFDGRDLVDVGGRTVDLNLIL